MDFTHTPRPPEIPPEDQFSNQRYYHDSDRVIHNVAFGTLTEVFRFADETSAKVSIRCRSGEMAARLTSAELYELARRCIDAAADIEAEGGARNAGDTMADCAEAPGRNDKVTS